jgi:hypothetical protein
MVGTAQPKCRSGTRDPALSLTRHPPSSDRETATTRRPLSAHTQYVAADPGGRDQLPIACTLGRADGARRLEDWRRVARRAGAGRLNALGKVTLKFRDLPQVGPELERLVAAERECCTFLGWKLAQTDIGWSVEITGDDDDLRVLPLT